MIGHNNGPPLGDITDVGGVRLGLDSPQEVRDAFDLMMLRIGHRLPEARIDGVFVE